MNKKIISAILASVFTLSCMNFSTLAATTTSGTTFATASYAEMTLGTAGSQEITGDVSFIRPVINVSIPAEFTAILNPYHIEIDIPGSNSAPAAKSAKDGVTSGVYFIENHTEEYGVIVRVKATVVDKTEDINVKTIDFVTGDGKAAKNLYATLKVSKDAAYSPKINNTPIYFSEDTENARFRELLLLPPASGDVKSIGYFQIGGDVNPEAEWTESDKVTLSMVLDFRPTATVKAVKVGSGD